MANADSRFSNIALGGPLQSDAAAAQAQSSSPILGVAPPSRAGIYIDENSESDYSNSNSDDSDEEENGANPGQASQAANDQAADMRRYATSLPEP